MTGEPVTDPATARARAYFEEFAGRYDEEAREAGWSPNRHLAASLAGAGPVADALDLACGNGATLAELERAFPGAAVTGVDIASAMVERSAARVPSARCLRADLGAFVECCDERFDVVTAIGGLEFTPDLPRVLSGLGGLVHPGGRAVLTYEPVLEGWAPQSARAETNLGSNGLELTTFRWEPGEVAAALGGWTTVEHRLLAAYRRDDVPAFYGWVHVRR